MTLTITIDEHTEQSLQQISRLRGVDPADMAARLLRHALRAAQPKPVYDIEALKAYTAENEAEELALAESDLKHRAELLAYEDRA